MNTLTCAYLPTSSPVPVNVWDVAVIRVVVELFEDETTLRTGMLYTIVTATSRFDYTHWVILTKMSAEVSTVFLVLTHTGYDGPPRCFGAYASQKEARVAARTECDTSLGGEYAFVQEVPVGIRCDFYTDMGMSNRVPAAAKKVGEDVGPISVIPPKESSGRDALLPPLGSVNEPKANAFEPKANAFESEVLGEPDHKSGDQPPKVSVLDR
jgi:hypothetical protein